MKATFLHKKFCTPIFLVVIALLINGCTKKSGAPDPTPPPVLSIKKISPTKAKIGEAIEITGTGFGTEASLIKIYFGYSGMVRASNFNDTMIRVIVPPDATDGRIKISMLLGDSVSSEQLFGVVLSDNDYPNLNKIQYTGSGMLSSSRSGMAAAGAGDKIVIAGGLILDGGSADADIYDIVSNTWQSTRLSEQRQGLSAGGVKDKILFAGGKNSMTGEASKTVDIYDVITGKWTTSQLSVARYGMAAAAIGTHIYFGGGTNGSTFYDVIDIYNTVTNTWTTGKLSIARADLAAGAIGDKVVFAGGEGYESNDQKGRVADVFTASGSYLNRTATNLLGTGRKASAGLAAAASSYKIIFGGGGNSYEPYLEAYDSANKVWSQVRINEEIRTGAAVGIGTKMVFSLDKGRTWVFDVFTSLGTGITHAGTAMPTVGATTKNKAVFAGPDGKFYDTFTTFK